jgi:hypothetical protein
MSDMLVQVPGLPGIILPIDETADPAEVTLSLRRGQCIDCSQFVRLNDTDDRFWPWLAEDGTTLCASQDDRWGHRVPREVAFWINDGKEI